MKWQGRRESNNIEDRRQEKKITHPAGEFQRNNLKYGAAMKGILNESPDEVFSTAYPNFYPGRTSANGTARRPTSRSIAAERDMEANAKNIQNIWRTGGGF